MEISSYPPGCSSVPGDEDMVIDLMEAMDGYVRHGHGLCGKDADLDYGGQITLENAWFNVDDGKLVALVKPYANICEPCPNDDESEEDYEARKEVAGEIVCTWNDYPGEWTGSDYWTFWMEGNPQRVEIDAVPSPPTFIDEPTEEELKAQAEALFQAIMNNPAILDFRQNMMDLAKAIEEAK